MVIHLKNVEKNKMKKILLLLLLPILSLGQNCAPTLIVKDTCSYGYAKTFVEWELLDSNCVISTSHQGTPYNTGSYSWNNQLDTNHIFYNNINNNNKKKKKKTPTGRP